MSSKMVSSYGRKRKKWYIRPFFLLSCWRFQKRRFQYLEEVNTHEEPSKNDNDGLDDGTRSELNDTASTHHVFSQQTQYFNVQEQVIRRSFQEENSIHSMDSLDSTCEIDDETSQVTQRIRNIHKDHLLMAHLNFLTESTQPQEVDLMYETMH
mmetsp:Transcript_46695/g.113789  ORF Transcript_46695/g.113789 Transcript_46695/m.113789 type:complete len:153 (+) Transcript_46695:418-876(+)